MFVSDICIPLIGIDNSNDDDSSANAVVNIFFNIKHWRPKYINEPNMIEVTKMFMLQLLEFSISKRNTWHITNE